MSSGISVQRIQGPRTLDEMVRQVNIALERINGQIIKASGTGGASAAALAALQAQVNNLIALSGSNINNGGTGVPAPTPGGGAVSVSTDGITIGGDGNATPIFLIKPLTYSVRAASSSPDTVGATDTFILASASAGADIIENLPAATGSGIVLIFKKVDANAHNVVITRAGADTIDGATTVTITIQYDMVRLVDGAAGAWSIW